MITASERIQIQHARTIGTLFLLAFVAYFLGRYSFERTVPAVKATGVALIFINSLMVLFIGFLFRKTLQHYSRSTANIYLLARIIEATSLSSVFATLMPGVTFSNDYDYFIAMLALGLGSIPMCMALNKYGIAPAWLANWGIIGYSVFSIGFMLELFGKEWSMYLLIIAGFWEITFALWLITKANKRR